MLASTPIPREVEASVLGRVDPLVKLGVALVWLIGLATTTRILPPLVLTVVAVVGAAALGRVGPRRLFLGLGPLLLAALGIATANLVFGVANTDPIAREVARIGPLRLTEPAIAAAAGLFVRVLAIVAVGGVFALTTSPTRLVDALVQHLHIPARFAYGALAAYQAVPRLGEDLASLRATRVMRGLGTSWHPRILVGLLVRAIRHADQLAIAMDARAFGSGRRTTYRPIRWSGLDVLIGVGCVIVLVAALRVP